MSNINTNLFTDEYLKIGAMFLVECLSKTDRDNLKKDWIDSGGMDNMPWWKWCLEKINVTYSNKAD